MALLHRFSRLLSADLHAVLDRLEDPLVLLQQAQREMVSALTEQRSRLATLTQSLQLLERDLEQGNGQLEALAGELNLCLDSDNEALARTVIKRRLALEAERQLLERDQVALQEQRQALADAIERQQADLETITAETERLTERWHYQASTPTGPVNHSDAVTDEAVELALLAERRARGNAA